MISGKGVGRGVNFISMYYYYDYYFIIYTNQSLFEYSGINNSYDGCKCGARLTISPKTHVD